MKTSLSFVKISECFERLPARSREGNILKIALYQPMTVTFSLDKDVSHEKLPFLTFEYKNDGKGRLHWELLI